MIGAAVFGGMPAYGLDVDFDYHLLVLDDYLDSSGSSWVLRGEDNDGNGLLEEDQLGMLSTILAGGDGVSSLDPGMRAAIQSAYPPNFARVNTDLTVSLPFPIGTVSIIDQLAASTPDTGEALQHVLAGLMTLADTVTITFINALMDEVVAIYLTTIGQESYIADVQGQIDFQACNYGTFGDAPTETNYLGAAGDVDDDDDTNLDEYSVGGVQKTRETWLTDNCIDPPMRIVTVEGGGAWLTGTPHTFSVMVTGGIGNYFYVWRKGDEVSYIVVGTESIYEIEFLTTSHCGAYYCVVTDMDGGTVVTTRRTPSAYLNVVYVGIYFSQQPSGGNKMTGQTHTLSCLAKGGVGPGPYQYTWRRDGAPVGPNARSWTIDPITMGDAGAYTVDVTSNGGPDTITSNPAVLNVTAAPFSLDQQPVGGQKYAGEAHTFSVSVSGGSGLFSYDWRKGGVSLGAADTPSLVLDPLAVSNAGAYTCVVTDTTTPGTPVTSNPAELEVAEPVTITQQPVSATLYEGDTFSISVVAEGGYGGLEYQWKWGVMVLPGETHPVYSATALSGYNGSYRCVVTDQHIASVASDAAVLTVLPPVEITVQPEGGDYESGGSHTFTIEAQGGQGTLHYDWRKDGVSLGAADQDNLPLDPLSPSDTGTYTCVVSDEYTAVVESDAALLRVAGPLSITVQPEPGVIYEGQTYVFSVTIDGGIEPIAYQWRLDGADIPGATESTYETGVAGSYTCRVTDDGEAEVLSAAAGLVVLAHLGIAGHPQSADVYTGASHQFTVVVAGGMGAIHYEWRKNSASLGAPDQSTLTLEPVGLGDAGDYTCFVWDEGTDSVESDVAVLRVADPLMIVTQPEGAALVVGQWHTFSIEAEGGYPPVEYQWRKDGDDIPGAVETTYDTGPVTSDDAGAYTCVVSDALGSEAASDGTAVLSVSEGVTITEQPDPADVYTGASHQFVIAASGGLMPLHYDWYKDGFSLGAPDLPVLTIDPVTLEHAGMYSCLVFDGVTDPALSGEAELGVADPVSIVAQPEGAALYVGESHVFSIAVTGGFAPISYQWQHDALDIPGEILSTYDTGAVSTDAAGVYTCVVHDAVSSSVTSDGTAVLVVHQDLGIITHPVSAAVYVEESHTFTIAASGGAGGLHYDWRKAGVSLGAPNDPTLTLNNVGLLDAGAYTCVVTDEEKRSVTSEAAELQVAEPLELTQQPVGANKYIGDAHEFLVEATGGYPELRYQWRKDGDDLAGAATASYERTSLLLADSGIYTCAVNDAQCANQVSDGAVLTVSHHLAITSQPEGADKYSGDTHLFSVAVQGGIGAPQYQWQKDGDEISGADQPTYSLGAVDPDDTGIYTCVVTDEGADEVTSNDAVLRVGDPLTIITQPEGGDAYAGESHVFAVAVTGGIDSLSYQWQHDGSDVPGAIEATYDTGLLFLSSAGSYVCIIADAAGGSVTSDEALLTVSNRISFLAHPAGADVYLGQAHVFSVSAQGGIGQRHYAWRKDGAPLAAPDEATYTLSEAAVGDAGLYDCVVTDDGSDSKTSDTAALTVSEPLSITTQPQEAHRAAGEIHTFTVGVQGGIPPMGYQWSKDGGLLTGATGATLALGALSQPDAGVYACTVSDGGTDVVTTDEAVLTVLAITVQPEGATKPVGDSHTFSITAAGGVAPLGYQWRLDGFNVLAPNLPSYTAGPLSPSDQGAYTCVVTDAAGASLTSDEAFLHVSDNPILFEVQPEGGAKYTGESHSFLVEVSHGAGGFTYQWQHDPGAGFDDLDGATEDTLALDPLVLAHDGRYRCVVHDAVSQMAVSDTVVLDVAAPPAIAAQPQSVACYVGDSATFSVVVTGGLGGVHYAWKHNGVAVGQDAPACTIAPVGVDDAGVYSCEISDDRTTLDTDGQAQLAVSSALEILEHPVGGDRVVGETHSFEVVVTGGIPPVTYQWRRDGVDIAGANAAEYVLGSVGLADAGAYTCFIRDSGAMSETTQPAELTISAALTITQHPQGAAVYVGASKTFSVSTAGGVGGLHYQWRQNGLARGGDSATYAISSVRLTDAGGYACEVYDQQGSVTSQLAVLQVGQPMTITQQPQSAGKYEGDFHTFSVSVSGGIVPLEYQWSKGSQVLAGRRDASFTIAWLTLSDQGHYSCEVADAGTMSLATGAANGDLRVSAPLAISSTPQRIAKVIGESARICVATTGGLGTLQYEWKHNGQDIVSTSASFMLGPLSIDHGGSYSCVVTDEIGPVAADGLIDLVVGELLRITRHPQSVFMLSGEPHTFSVDVVGVGNLTYRWEKEDLKGVVGYNAPIYYLERVALGDAGAYTCTVTDETGRVRVSNMAVLTVEYQAMTFIQQPRSGATAPGFPFTLSVEVRGGSGPLHYQWKKDGQPILDSPDARRYGFTAEEGDAGAYTCEVSDDLDTVVSAVADVTTDAPVPLGGLAGLALLTALTALAGAAMVRKRR